MRAALIYAAVAAGVFCVLPLFRRLALFLNIVDVPGPRSVHAVVTPRVGGLAIALGAAIALIFLGRNVTILPAIVWGGAIIFCLGIADDVFHLGAGIRIVLQLIAALVLALGGGRVEFLPQGFIYDAAEIAITVLWVVGVVNSYNYLDGLDGLAAGSAVINFGCFAVILHQTGQLPLLIMCLVLMAACVGFIPHNFSAKKVFLGDAGSTLLGFLLAAVAVSGNWAEDHLVRLSIPVLILGVPIFDMIFTTIMRVKDDKVNTVMEWLRYGGKDHFHHCLVDVGFLPRGAVAFIYCVTLSLGISAVIVSRAHALEAALALAQAAIIFGVIATLIVVGKRRRSGWQGG